MPLPGPNIQMQFMRLSRCLPQPLIGAALAALAAACSAQVMQAPGTMPDGRRIPVPQVGPHSSSQSGPGITTPTPLTPGMPGQIPAGMPGATPAGMPPRPGAQPGTTTPGSLPTAPGTSSVPFVTPRPGSDLPSQPLVPPSLLDKPAQPATVKLSDGALTVTANNSSLTAILHDLSASSGMSLDGLGKDQRVFGVYGPGSPRDILSQLLDGAGYNFLMVGQTDAGVPREVVLTARTNAPLSAPGPSSRSEEDEEPMAAPAEEINTPAPMPTPTPSDQQRPRSPQQMLQELQQLRQQQQQQAPIPTPTPQQPPQ